MSFIFIITCMVRATTAKGTTINKYSQYIDKDCLDQKLLHS